MTTAQPQQTKVSTPRERPWQFSLLKMLLWFVALGVLMAFLRAGWIAVGTAREAGRCSCCQGHCKQLAVALHSYHEVYRSFPPAYVADASGKPMHSWRVLLLPYIEEQSLYQRYNFNEPWDGPNNRLLAAEMPRTYRCHSSDPRQPVDETNYVVVVGDGTAWPGTQTVSLDQVTDRKEETLLFVEVQGSGISWMEPRDLDVNTMPLRVNPRGKFGISSRHPGRANVSMVDGKIGVLNDATSARELRTRLTIAAGD